jgi:histidine ammonia-lyase
MLGSPIVLAAGFRCLRKRFHRSTGNPSRVANTRIQDAYSLRCMPQVHGAVRGALEHAREIVQV